MNNINGSSSSNPTPSSSSSATDPSSSSSPATIPQKQWELENRVQNVASDELFVFDQEAQQSILEARPWRRDPHYFKKVKVSALALLKMVMHTQSAAVSSLALTEVMGLMQGKIEGDTFIVLDAFALPVEGTETRVNAGNEAIEYTNIYTEMQSKVGRMENVVGWYHSHPGFGCWLSGIDVNTQMTNQLYQDPFMAVVIDPLKTISAGKVDIKAFRTYPEGYKPPESSSSYLSVPLEKVDDFGMYWDKYYEMDMEFFKSSTDANMLSRLWNRYWMKTLSSSPLVKNRFYTDGQIADLASKMEKAESEIARGARSALSLFGSKDAGKKKKKEEESQLSKINKDSVKLSVEVLQGVATQLVKQDLFNHDFTSNSSNSTSNNNNNYM